MDLSMRFHGMNGDNVVLEMPPDERKTSRRLL